ncbi:unnamed protein product, partial [Staurois parvus]
CLILTSLILPSSSAPLVSPETYCVETLCTCSVWCLLLESACDQHRANQHCPHRGQGFCILLEQKENSYNKL